MGSALTFKSIFESIDSDFKNQYYADVFTQYGRMIRTVFDFNPMELSSLIEDSSYSNMEIESEFLEMEREIMTESEEKGK